MSQIGIVVGDSLFAKYSFGYANKSSVTKVTPETGFQLASITKPVLATLTLKLYSLGRIDIDKLIQTYLSDIQLPASRISMTHRHLLSHSSGLPQDPISRVDIPETSVPKPYSQEELVKGLEEKELLYESGLEFSYSNLGYHLIGHVLEKTEGRNN